MRQVAISVFFILFSICLFAQTPAVEVRAVWLTTNWGLDWPTQKISVAFQKKELQNMLDKLQEQKINLVLFQARAQGSVFYRSAIEPLNPVIVDSEGFDPLAFAVEECHKRGMECHAWLATFPMESVKYTGRGRKKEAINDKPNYYKEVDGRWYLDPGQPEARKRIVSVAEEIVTNYDIDGIHFDYIRYPSNTRKFPDDDTYKKYGEGKNLFDWRRENINALVFDVYDKVKSHKKWVQVSSAPLGRYKILPHLYPNDGWTAYETVFQDAGYWMKSNKHDLMFPMMYHREGYFYPFLDDWVANSNGKIVVPGLGIYQMMPSEQNWAMTDIANQMDYTRKHNIAGQSYFRAGNITNNMKGISDSLRTFYANPAKLPPLTWLDNEASNSPLNLQVYRENGVVHIQWDAPDDSERFTFTVYVSDDDNVNTSDSYNIIETGLHSTSFSFSAPTGEFGVYYSITASDRYHNESVPCVSAYFTFSEEVR